jgi:serine/threonine protein kinase/tetratricopeptide (TPR) repeat protein
MSPGRSRSDRERLGELFERALALEPRAHSAFVDAECGDDAALRAELTALLASHAAAPGYLERLGRRLLPAALEAFSQNVLPVGRVVGRYEILERLGAGGMAVVYKARDLDLDRPVALKFLPMHLSADPVARDRLKREARAVSVLDHPNIAVIHEIGATDPVPDGPEGGRLFIAMAYYPGETLEQKIDRARLAIPEALDYAVQLTDALATAHQAGIVHRDVKPANVLVTHGGQLKLVDFGVAKVSGAGVTREGTTPGTIAYMSPEQTRGDAADQRTDIWSLGVVLYEMLAGDRPFRGEADEAVVYGIRHDEPPELETLRADVPPELARIVDRCLAKDPSLRYPSADALLAELRAVAGTSAHDETRPSRVRWKRPLALAAIGGLAIILGAQWLTSSRSPILHADRVVVAPFENRTGDPAHDPFGGIAAEGITRDLQRAGIAGVVPADVAHASAAYVRTVVNESPGRDAIQTLAEETGAGLVVAGVYYLRGDSLHVQAAITDARRGKSLPLEPVGAPGDELTTAVDRLGQRTLAALAQILEPRLPPEMRFRERPSLNFEAHLARVAGWEAESRYAWEEALGHYDRVLEADSTDLNARLRLASLRTSVWGNFDLQQRTDVDSMLRALNRSRERLVPSDQAWLDYLIAARGRDAVQIYETAKRAAALSPGSTVAQYRWGLEALRLNRPREAIRILSGIDPRTFARGHFPAIDYWITLADAHHLLGDHRRMLEVTRSALTLHPDEPALLMSEATALAALGRLAEARSSIDARLALPPHRHTPSLMFLLMVGRELERRGDRDAAREMVERAIAWYGGRSAADRAGYYPLMYYGIALNHVGRFDEAEAAFRAAAAEAPEDSVPGLAIWANAWLGITAAQRGDLAEVRRIEEWLGGDRPPWGWGSFFRACIAAELERKDEAVARLRQAYSEGMQRNPGAPRIHRYPCFDSLQDYRPFQELIRPRG